MKPGRWCWENRYQIIDCDCTSDALPFDAKWRTLQSLVLALFIVIPRWKYLHLLWKWPLHVILHILCLYNYWFTIGFKWPSLGLQVSTLIEVEIIHQLNYKSVLSRLFSARKVSRLAVQNVHYSKRSRYEN